jgi:hypothetical protein
MSTSPKMEREDLEEAEDGQSWMPHLDKDTM